MYIQTRLKHKEIDRFILQFLAASRSEQILPDLDESSAVALPKSPPTWLYKIQTGAFFLPYPAWNSLETDFADRLYNNYHNSSCSRLIRSRRSVSVNSNRCLLRSAIAQIINKGLSNKENHEVDDTECEVHQRLNLSRHSKRTRKAYFSHFTFFVHAPYLLQLAAPSRQSVVRAIGGLRRSKRCRAAATAI